eukprot:NODE_37_length_35953_cov_1.028037.p12 type:complete len:139 gc:universal NODE_37_length_35953_cov_1.028037:32358-31942(-)
MLFRHLTLISITMGKKARHRPSVPAVKFNFNAITDSDAWINFRFYKSDICELQDLLEIPSTMKLSNGSVDLCVFLKRMSYPNRLSDLVVYFGIEQSKISRICDFVLNHIYYNFKWLLDFPEHLFTHDYITLAQNQSML